MRFPLLFLIAALPACAQHFSAGIKGGVPLTDFINGARNQNFSFVTNTNRYVIGGQAELRLIAGFGVEFDALYRHFGYDTTETAGSATVTANTTAGAWEFPLLVKYRFPTPIARPFVDAGVAWNHLSGLKQSVLSALPNAATNLKPAKDTITGFVLGVGVDIHILAHIQPEIRYTRWGSQHFPSVNTLLNSNQNQAEFLVGITF
jgi:opacity protein-like surface antigen